MTRYIFIRFLLLLPTLFVISLIVFFISKAAPGDPALERLEKQSSDGSSMDYYSSSELLQKSRAQLGLDKAAFYFELGMHSSPDSLFKIPHQRERQMLKGISFLSGQAELSRKYFQQLKKLPANNYRHELLGEGSIQKALQIVENMPSTEYSAKLKAMLEQLSKRKFINNYLPKIQFHGWDNQYHQWLSKVLHWEFGKSYNDGQEVSTKIARALKLSLGLSLAALLVSYLFAILLAIFSMYYEEGLLGSLLSNFFLILYSLPVFIVASFLLLFFGSSEYLQWFPVYGIGSTNDEMPFWEVVGIRMQHLFLPLLSLSYVSIAFLYQQLYISLSSNLKMDYIKVARAKGLSKLTVIGKHAFGNSLIPLIAHLGNIFPAIVGGSFVVEFIFSLPGMGMLTLESIFDRDYPSIYAILLLVSFVGLIGALLSDILLAVFDPRVNFARSNKQSS